jgi:hypothetical protein
VGWIGLAGSGKENTQGDNGIIALQGMKGTDQDIERGRNGRSDATKGMARATFLVHVRSPWHDLYSAYHVQYHAVCTDTHVPTHTSILFFMWEVLVPLPLCLSPCSPFVQRFYVRFRPTIK